MLTYLSDIQLKIRPISWLSDTLCLQIQSKICFFHLLTACFESRFFLNTLWSAEYSPWHERFQHLKKAAAWAGCATGLLWSALQFQTWKFGFPKLGFFPAQQSHHLWESYPPCFILYEWLIFWQMHLYTLFMHAGGNFIEYLFLLGHKMLCHDKC